MSIKHACRHLFTIVLLPLLHIKAHAQKLDCGSNLVTARPELSFIGEPLPLPITDENLRRILEHDGFNNAEIEEIILAGKKRASDLAGKKIDLEYLEPNPTPPSADAYLSPWDYLRYWPFIKRQDPSYDVQPLLEQILKVASSSDWDVAIPLARWSLFLPSNIRHSAKIRSLVVQTMVREPDRVGVVAEKLIEYFNIQAKELHEIIENRIDYPLEAVTYMRTETYPRFSHKVIKLRYISAAVWTDLKDISSRVRVLQHTNEYCGDCANMLRWHRATLEKHDPDWYGYTALIRLNGSIVGVLKVIGNPSFLALRNMGTKPGDPNFVWAGAVYQTDSKLVNQAKVAILSNGLRFPVLDVDELPLKPVAFLNEPVAQWVHGIQRELNELTNPNNEIKR